MSAGKYRKEHNCLNCGQHVEKHYCSSCGQPNIEINESFWGFISHSVAHYFHFDNKFFQTLKPLLTKPGQVTLDYLAGKRARYINPVSMYIFVSIIYFLAVPHALDSEKKDASQNITTEDSIRKAGKYQKIILNKEESTNYAAYMARQKSLPEAKRDNWFERYVQKKQIAINRKKAEGKFDLETELKKYQPKQYFLLMPLLAFFIMLNFRKNHIYYLHHLIFTIHGMTAYFIISIVAEPLKAYVFGRESFLSSVLSFLVSAGILWYLYTGLKVFYNRSRAVTIRKTIMVVFLYSISLGISAWVIEQVFVYLLA